MRVPLGERPVTLGGTLAAIVVGFAALVAALWFLSGAEDGRLLLAYGGAGLLLALGEIGFNLAAHNWLTPARTARLALVVMPLLAVACYAWVRLFRGDLGVPAVVAVVWILYGTWATWRTWRRLARAAPST